MKRICSLALLLLLFVGCMQPAVVPVPDTVDPPAPLPTPQTDGLKVLILYESQTEEIQKLPPKVLLAIQSGKLRDWMTERKIEWRIWDQDTDVRNESEFWQKAIKLPHDSLPWIWVTNGSEGFNGKFDLSTDEAIQLIGRYAK